MRYRLNTGSIAWIIHRSTGIALTLYIFVHLYVLGHLRDPAQYRSLMALMKNPLVKLGEAGLLALVVAHAFNGARLTLLDLGVSTRIHKALFWGAVATGGMLCLVGAWVFLGGGR
jgi:succinate dehydrogenase / fumarate reductase cytochrome b subunit